MKRYILFTDEELDDMIHGRELELRVGGETLYFMAEGHFTQQTDEDEDNGIHRPGGGWFND